VLNQQLIQRQATLRVVRGVLHLDTIEKRIGTPVSATHTWMIQIGKGSHLVRIRLQGFQQRRQLVKKQSSANLQFHTLKIAYRF
jgi:hypothetical protein